MKLFLLLFLLAFQGAGAQTVAEDRPEFEVQRREFESHLSSKVDTALKAILEEGTYILDISVTLKKLPAEVVEVGSAQDNERFPLDSQAQFNGAAGLVPLGKIGVWNRGATEQRKRTVVRQVRRFTDLIDTVSADLYLDPDKVSSAQKTSVSRVVESILKSSSPVKVALHLSDLKIYHPKKADENLRADLMNEIKKQIDAEKPKASAAAEKKDQPSFISEFKIPFTIIFATAALFMLGLIVNRRQAQSEERRLKLDEDISRRTEEKLRSHDAARMEVAVQDKQATVAMQLPENQAVGGFSKFGEIATSEPNRAGFILKQWIYSADVHAQGALAILPRLVSITQLNGVLKLLTDDDRKEWTRVMNKPVGSATFAELDAYVAKGIAASIVEPMQEIDAATRQLLATVTPQEAADCIYRDKTVGVLLVQLLPGLQVSRIFNLLDEQIIRDIALSSTTVTKAQVSFLALKFQSIISDVRETAKAQTSAFVQRVPELIREVGFAKEAALYDSVAATRNSKLLYNIANEYLPAELISSLPTDILKAVFDRVPLAERAELVFSSPEEIRRALMMTVGEGRLKDVLEIEIEEIRSNDIRVRTINRASSRLWQSFVDRVRLKINESPDYAQEIEPLIDNWVKQKLEAAAAGDLRAAS